MYILPQDYQECIYIGWARVELHCKNIRTQRRRNNITPMLRGCRSKTRPQPSPRTRPCKHHNGKHPRKKEELNSSGPYIIKTHQQKKVTAVQEHLAEGSNSIQLEGANSLPLCHMQAPVRHRNKSFSVRAGPRKQFVATSKEPNIRQWDQKDKSVHCLDLSMTQNQTSIPERLKLYSISRTLQNDIHTVEPGEVTWTKRKGWANVFGEPNYTFKCTSSSSPLFLLLPLLA